jgi:DNA-binding response OmpR family regulator
MGDKPKRILLAEDDTSIIEVMTIILESEGYVVSKAQEREAVIHALEEKIPDLIFLDINLGGESGEEIARELKGRAETDGIALVMLSADDKTQEIAKRVHADGFLLKPFDIDTLIATVRKYL